MRRIRLHLALDTCLNGLFMVCRDSGQRGNEINGTERDCQTFRGSGDINGVRGVRKEKQPRVKGTAERQRERERKRERTKLSPRAVTQRDSERKRENLTLIHGKGLRERQIEVELRSDS